MTRRYILESYCMIRYNVVQNNMQNMEEREVKWDGAAGRLPTPPLPSKAGAPKTRPQGVPAPQE